jgi:hypothetical protein
MPATKNSAYSSQTPKAKDRPRIQKPRYDLRNRWIGEGVTSTGVTFKTDSFKTALWRLRTSIHSWVDAMQSIENLDSDMYMITLTYADVDAWKPNQIRDFCSWLRRNKGSNLLSYSWVGELQERGAVHYHLVAHVKKGTKIPHPDKPQGRKNFTPWQFGHTKVEKARSAGYLVKYLGKEYQKDYSRFPKGARGYGVWVSKELPAVDFVKGARKYATLPIGVKKATLRAMNEDASSVIQENTSLFLEHPEIFAVPKFAEVQERVKRIPTTWYLDDVPLSEWTDQDLESSQTGIIRDERGRYRVRLCPDDFESQTILLKETSDVWREKNGLTKDPGGWCVDGELLEPQAQVTNFSRGDSSTWVAELIQQNENRTHAHNTTKSELQKKISRFK